MRRAQAEKPSTGFVYSGNVKMKKGWVRGLGGDGKKVRGVKRGEWESRMTRYKLSMCRCVGMGPVAVVRYPGLRGCEAGRAGVADRNA